MDTIADPALAGWPLALVLASVAIAERARSARRRGVLNRALHELRRPLQALALAGGGLRHGQLEAAIGALEDLDREINGGARRTVARIEAGALARAAIERWRGAVLGAGRAIELRWSVEPVLVECDPALISRALDNLIANSLEHGSGTVRLSGSRRPGRVRFHVCDGAAGSSLPPSGAPRRGCARRGDPRRGHGLELVAEVAAKHGGRFGVSIEAGGASSVIELPLAGDR